MRIVLKTPFVVFAAVVLCWLLIVTPSPVAQLKDSEPLKVTAELVGQVYCVTSGTKLAMSFKIRMCFANQTNRKLIVEKSIGTAFGEVIAADTKSFSERRYEYDSSGGDRFTTWNTPDGKEPKEQTESPEPNFVILAPGESFQREDVYYASLSDQAAPTVWQDAPLPAGSHVLGVWISAWDHQPNPEAIRKKWESLGDLVYKSILVGPVPINIPSAKNTEHCPR